MNSSLLHELNTKKEILYTREEALSYVFNPGPAKAWHDLSDPASDHPDHLCYGLGFAHLHCPIGPSSGVAATAYLYRPFARSIDSFLRFIILVIQHPYATALGRPLTTCDICLILPQITHITRSYPKCPLPSNLSRALPVTLRGYP